MKKLIARMILSLILLPIFALAQSEPGKVVVVDVLDHSERSLGVQMRRGGPGSVGDDRAYRSSSPTGLKVVIANKAGITMDLYYLNLLPESGVKKSEAAEPQEKRDEVRARSMLNYRMLPSAGRIDVYYAGQLISSREIKDIL